MSVTFNAVWSHSSQFINEIIEVGLTPLQRTIAIFAAAFFACALLGYVVLNSCYFRVSKKDPLIQEDEKTDPKIEEKKEEPQLPMDTPIASEDTLEVQENKTEDPKIEDNEQKAGPLKDSPPVPEVKIPSDQETKKHLTVQERLEKNRKIALEQQQSYRERKQKFIDSGFKKPFKLIQGEIPAEFPVRIRGKCLIDGSIQEDPLIDRKIDSHELTSHLGRLLGWSGCAGRRPAMEDTATGKSGKFQIKEKSHSFELRGIFDGHGGSGAAQFVADNLVKYLIDELQRQCNEGVTDEGIYRALKECCIKLDADYEGDAGTTATFAFFFEGRMWIANVGDSRAILVKDGNVVQASEDAKPSIERYKRKIERMGGMVMTTFSGGGRINGELAVARAIGDKWIVGSTGPAKEAFDRTLSEFKEVIESHKKGIKQEQQTDGHSIEEIEEFVQVMEKIRDTPQKCCVSPQPKITCYPDDFDYLLLATDGLFDVATSDEVGQCIQEMHESGLSPMEMAKRLLYSAIRGDTPSNDNVSIIVIKRPIDPHQELQED